MRLNEVPRFVVDSSAEFFQGVLIRDAGYVCTGKSAPHGGDADWVGADSVPRRGHALAVCRRAV